MAISTTKGTKTKMQPEGGVALSPECKIATYLITAPTDGGSPTGFSVAIDGLSADSNKIVGWAPLSAAAAGLSGVYFTFAAGLLTMTCGASALTTGMTWHVTIMTQL